MALALVQTPSTAIPEPDEIRAMTAMLCWRRRWLSSHLAPRDYQAAQLLVVLLQANFSHRELRGDPPGVAGAASAAGG